MRNSWTLVIRPLGQNRFEVCCVSVSNFLCVVAFQSMPRLRDQPSCKQCLGFKALHFFCFDMAESFFEVSGTHNQCRSAVLENIDSPASILQGLCRFCRSLEDVQSSILNRFHVPKLQHGGMTCAPRRFACSCDPWCEAAVPCPKFCD